MTISLNHAHLGAVTLLFVQWFGAIVGQNTEVPVESLFEEVFPLPTEVSSSTERDPIIPQPATPSSNCECAPFYRCRGYDQTVLLIDPRMSGCNGSLEICCDEKMIDTDQPTTKPPTYERPMTAKCGLRNVNGVGFRITPGKESQFGEFPWTIALLKPRPTADQQIDLLAYACGGSLIHPQVVLTATHCVHELSNLEDLTVRAGEWDSLTTDEIIPYQERKVSQIVSHKNFSRGTLYNDISLLLLTKPFEYAPNVDVICLPDQSVVYTDSNCVASGWGKDKFGSEGSYQNIQKKVDLPLLNRNQCLARLRQTRLGPKFQLHESFICAGGKPGEDTCEGDGGSPLVCPIAGKRDYYRQVGIVSWGIGCSNDIPGVYVNVPKYRNWIDEQLKLFGLS